jgi:hypothetical protein
MKTHWHVHGESKTSVIKLYQKSTNPIDPDYYKGIMVVCGLDTAYISKDYYPELYLNLITEAEFNEIYNKALEILNLK